MNSVFDCSKPNTGDSCTDEIIIDMQSNVIKIQTTINNIQDTINKVQRYINSLNGEGIDVFGNYATIIETRSYLEFPNIGNSNNLYIDSTSNLMYRWDIASLEYRVLSSDFSIDDIDFSVITNIDGGSSIV